MGTYLVTGGAGYFIMAPDGLRLLVVDTHVKHALGVPFPRDIPYPEPALALSRLPDGTIRRRVRHVITGNRRVERVIDLLDAGRAREIRPVLTEGHASPRDDFEVSSPELDLVVSAIVLAPTEATDRIGAAILDAFAAGHQLPRVFEAIPSPGAQRLPL